MMEEESYLEKEERRRFLRSGGNSDIAENAFKISSTNRIINGHEQAACLMLLRMAAERTGISQIKTFCNDLEEMQMTMGEPENSRIYALRMTRAQYVPPEKNEAGK